MRHNRVENASTVRFIDLFAGIGGFRYAIQNAAREAGTQTECLFTSEIDRDCQNVYKENFGDAPHGDIAKIAAESIADHDILLAGFPCQPFSIIGRRKGFEDTRGTLFFDIARILKEKKPAAFVLENVKLLVGHNKGQTMARIMETLKDLGYHVTYKVLNALDFGLPQKRERIFIVGFRRPCSFQWPSGEMPMQPLDDILEKDVPEKFYASERIRKKRLEKQSPTPMTTIWHENKSGHISAYPFSCALRAGASYNYLLVNGARRLTPREMLRLQGFPEEFRIVCSDAQARKQAGNSLPVPVAQAVIKQTMAACGFFSASDRRETDAWVTDVRPKRSGKEEDFDHISKTAIGGRGTNTNIVKAIPT